MRKEQWKDVAGSPGYHVSSHGRVASQLRGPGSWRLLKACPNNVGYLSVKVPVNGDHKTAFVHRAGIERAAVQTAVQLTQYSQCIRDAVNTYKPFRRERERYLRRRRQTRATFHGK